MRRAPLAAQKMMQGKQASDGGLPMMMNMFEPFMQKLNNFIRDNLEHTRQEINNVRDRTAAAAIQNPIIQAPPPAPPVPINPEYLRLNFQPLNMQTDLQREIRLRQEAQVQQRLINETAEHNMRMLTEAYRRAAPADHLVAANNYLHNPVAADGPYRPGSPPMNLHDREVDMNRFENRRGSTPSSPATTVVGNSPAAMTTDDNNSITESEYRPRPPPDQRYAIQQPYTPPHVITPFERMNLDHLHQMESLRRAAETPLPMTPPPINHVESAVSHRHEANPTPAQSPTTELKQPSNTFRPVSVPVSEPESVREEIREGEEMPMSGLNSMSTSPTARLQRAAKQYQIYDDITRRIEKPTPIVATVKTLPHLDAHNAHVAEFNNQRQQMQKVVAQTLPGRADKLRMEMRFLGSRLNHLPNHDFLSQLRPIINETREILPKILTPDQRQFYYNPVASLLPYTRIEKYPSYLDLATKTRIMQTLFSLETPLLNYSKKVKEQLGRITDPHLQIRGETPHMIRRMVAERERVSNPAPPSTEQYGAVGGHENRAITQFQDRDDPVDMLNDSGNNIAFDERGAGHKHLRHFRDEKTDSEHLLSKYNIEALPEMIDLEKQFEIDTPEKSHMIDEPSIRFLNEIVGMDQKATRRSQYLTREAYDKIKNLQDIRFLGNKLRSLVTLPDPDKFFDHTTANALRHLSANHEDVKPHLQKFFDNLKSHATVHTTHEKNGRLAYMLRMPNTQRVHTHTSSLPFDKLPDLIRDKISSDDVLLDTLVREACGEKCLYQYAIDQPHRHLVSYYEPKNSEETKKIEWQM